MGLWLVLIVAVCTSEQDVREQLIQTRSLAVIGLKDGSQPFRKHLLDTIDARFDGFWRASQNHTDFSV